MFGIKKEYEMLNRILDDAAEGKSLSLRYDETELSKFQSKLVRVLSDSQISRQKVNEDREKLKELITNISHQTNTPLTNILIYSQLLEEQAENDTVRKYASEIILQAEKLEVMIRALVKMSRLETGIFQFEKENISLYELIRHAAEMEKMNAENKNILLITEDCEDVKVNADKKWTSEAVCNIVNNAVKYSYENSRITLGIIDYEMFSGVYVSDEGPGIPEEDLPRIFSRFFRGSSVHDKEGIGVGLYLSRQITEGQGGFIKVSSETGKGSRFELFLPKKILI